MLFVGAGGFEPPTSRTRTVRSTGLSHAPYSAGFYHTNHTESNSFYIRPPGQSNSSSLRLDLDDRNFQDIPHCQDRPIRDLTSMKQSVLLRDLHRTQCGASAGEHPVEFGAWLSPVERTVRVREVQSSNLCTPTNNAYSLPIFWY